MTDQGQIDNTSNSNNNTGYYAVNPQRVMQVFDMFNMRPSHFTAAGQPGAQKIYYDARKIIEGGTNNRWGHHTLKSIEGFCQFTQLKNDVVLPWQELIEHYDLYDGREGTGPRTGNQLLTLIRLQLNTRALVMWRERQSLSQQELANKTGLPTRLITAMENGDWDTVTENTARSISGALNVEQHILFTTIKKDVTTNVDEPISGASVNRQTSIPAGKHSKVKVLKLALVLVLIVLTSYIFYPNKHPQVAQPDSGSHNRNTKNNISNSHWFAKIVSINDSIPVEPNIKALWGKGAYLHLRKDGQLGFNWSTSNWYGYGPANSWRQKDNMLTIDFGDVSYSFDLNQDRDKLTTFNNEGGVFKMTMQK